MILQRNLASTRQMALGLLLLAIAAGGMGCGLPKQWHDLANKMPEATAQDPAYQMLCIWEPAEGVDEKGLPTRGFAGKITFFTRRQKTGVRVHGDVLVSVLDDQSPPEKRGQPLRDWKFPGLAWDIHLQDSQLGPAYSVFIPYSRKGTHQAQCALQVKFTPEGGGQPVYSDTVAVVLPGPPGKKDNQPQNAGQTDTRNSLNSITIPLHEKRKAHLANLELGKTERSHTVAPASELVQKQPTRPITHVPTASKRTLETLPAPPRNVAPHVMPPEEFTPDEAAKPVSETSFAPHSAAFPTSARSSATGISGWDDDADESQGTNPFNR